MKERVRVAVVGAGIGTAHARSASKAAAADLAVICDVDESRAAKLAAEYGAEAMTDFDKLLARKDIDAVTLGVPNYLHASMAIAALKAGKHVMCEKPMATTVAEADAMAAAARESGLVFMMAHNRRFTGPAMLLKQYIDQGDLGHIYAARTGWLRRTGIPGGAGAWFRRKDRAGGGPLIDLGVHVLDLTLWYMGFPEVSSVTGATYAEFGPTGRGFWGEPEPGNLYDVEDLAMAMIRLVGGATVVVEASWASFVEKETVYLQLLGTQGGANYDPPRVFTERYGQQVNLELTAPKIDGYEGEMAHFVECIRQGREPIATVEQGRTMIRILDAIYRSAAEGREIVLADEGAGARRTG